MVIMLVDMDCFFASVEQRDNPELVGKPIAVGSTEKRLGVVATCSYEARQYGVHSAMPSSLAKSLCPEIIFVNPNFEKYKKASNEVMDILRKYSEKVEQVSIDEAYVDLTDICEDNVSLASSICEDMRKEIQSTVGITATIGLSTNKFVAKVSASTRKPNFLNVVEREEVYSFISKLKISKFRGVGGKTLETMEANGIGTGEDLRNQSMERLVELFGESRAMWFYKISRGVDDRKVVTVKEPRKSINLSRTYSKNIKSNRVACMEIIMLVCEMCQNMKKKNLRAKTITLKIRYSDFTMSTKSRSIATFTDDIHVTLKTIFSFFKDNKIEKPVRLFGLSMSNLEDDQKFNLW